MKKLILAVSVLGLFAAQHAVAGLSAAQLQDAITFCTNNGLSVNDPVVYEGTAGNAGHVTCVKADIKAAPGTPSAIGVNHILIQAE